MGYYKNKIHHNNTFEDSGIDSLKSWLTLGGLALLLVSLFSVYGFIDTSHNSMARYLKSELFSMALVPVILLTLTIFSGKSEAFFYIFLFALIIVGSIKILLLIEGYHRHSTLMLILILSISSYLLGAFYFAQKISQPNTFGEEDSS